MTLGTAAGARLITDEPPASTGLARPSEFHILGRHRAAPPHPSSKSRPGSGQHQPRLLLIFKQRSQIDRIAALRKRVLVELNDAA
jgi:hypothetical protein